MEIFAKHRFARISARKARLVVDLVRGLKAERALEVLAYQNKKAAPLVKKVLVSAIANAQHNQGLNFEELWVSKAYVDEGSRMKRTFPRAKGRGDKIEKKTSHITLAVSEQRG